MKRKIGIISRYDKNISGKDVFIMYDSFKNIILDNGLLPICIIPPVYNINNSVNDKEEKDINELLDMCDGIILQGGDDFYDYDKKVCEYAIKNNKPILGICLGMQCMASIYQNNLNKINNHNDTFHKINIVKNSKLFNILGEDNILVNSYHNEYVNDPGIYSVSALSYDNVIESIEYNNNTFNLGVQFHPEKTYYEDENMKKIFVEFFDSIKNLT